MQIDPLQRSVQLSVRELAIFRNQPGKRGHGFSPWRASVGQQWHQTAAQEIQAEHPEVQLEQRIEIKWRHRDWNFQLAGRMDQLLPSEDGFLIREIKTIRSPLPSSEESLIEDYKDYFAQVSIYQAMLSVLPDYQGNKLTAEVQFINIENGARQSVALREQEVAFFEQQLDAIYPFLEERRGSHLRIQEAELTPAFETLREGQAELFTTLDEATHKAQVVLMEAPTGFGKTGIVLEHALKHLQSGLYERCIYLSSKSTGQIQTIEQLKRMIGSELRYLQMRNRSEHKIESLRHTCTGDERCDEAIGQHWREADIHPPELFSEGTVTLSANKEFGAKTGVCPYTLTKACLPFAEIWIGDSNYVFSPSSQPIFGEVHGFNPARTLLIVDEAHNLPARSADSLSVELASGDLLFAIEELHANGAPRRLISIANEICRWIESLSTKKALNPNELYTGQDLCEDFTQQLQEARFDYATTAPFAIELIWRIPTLVDCLSAAAHEYLTWIPQAGLLRSTCLDASDWIGKCLQPFGSTILMSATLQPFDDYRTHLGIEDKKCTYAQGNAPWRKGAYNIAIDRRVDTRLRAREQSYETTARTIVQCIQFSPGVPVAIFFSSYQYADNVMAYTAALHPEMRLQRQPRGGDLSEQTSFIEESLLISDAIFLIMGSSYAEGIDQLGGRVDQIIIVGPALPEVNLIQKTKMEQHVGISTENVFRDVYIRPAMRRIHQALGRIVRAPGQTARVLLHGKRFAEPAYLSELSAEYQTEHLIENDNDLAGWLESASQQKT